ncbi:MAG TPA: CoA transferase [Candidatus Angelobacter sp.]|jgi:crotonobetainyl-CoA:carnitine CoA-transferase CaiB-like acyl-CoA transferase|nr:CoA transferase [Candidatus Angelobacter sp.]
MSNSDNLLSGIRVIDCGTYIAGPAAATVMSDFGAEVIKIERPPLGDPYRYLSLLPGMPASDLFYCWILDARNKKSVALDLGKPAGREALLKLVSTADVFITNYQPSLVKKFRLAYEDLQPLNNRLIYAHITGYGDVGSEAEKPGYDATAYYARSGLMNTMHNGDAEPCLSPAGFGDHPTSMTLFGGIMMALYRRTITGHGMKVFTSLAANGAWSHACGIQAALVNAQFAPRTTRKAPSSPLVNHYVTRDQKRFLTCCLDPKKDWCNLARALGRLELVDDPRFLTPELRRTNSAELVAIIDSVVGSRDMAEWVEIFRQNDVIWAPVLSTAEVAQDEQMAANGVFAEIAPGLRTVNNPLNFADVKKIQPSLAPQIGEHTVEVLRSIGYGTEAIDSLIEEGVAMTSNPTTVAKVGK